MTISSPYLSQKFVRAGTVGTFGVLGEYETTYGKGVQGQAEEDALDLHWMEAQREGKRGETMTQGLARKEGRETRFFEMLIGRLFESRGRGIVRYAFALCFRIGGCERECSDW